MSALPSYAEIQRDSFSEAHGSSALVRTQMESGPPKQRKVATRSMVQRSITLQIRSKANYAAFIVWVRDTLNCGADWFTFKDPVDGATKSGRLVGGEYTAAPIGSMEWWAITATLETWE